MDVLRLLPLIIQGMASTSFFASRPLLTIFCFSAFARMGLSVWGNDAVVSFAPSGYELVSYGGGATIPWLLSEPVLVVLLLLAVFELLANKYQDLRFFYERILWLVQPGSAFAVTYSFAGAETTLFFELARNLLPHAPVAVASLAAPQDYAEVAARLNDGGAGPAMVQGGLLLWAGIIGFITWVIGRLRAIVVDFVEDIDGDNSLGLMSLMRWAETGWTVFGVGLVFVLPSLALLMAGLTALSLYLLRLYFERRERLSYIPCGACGAQLHPSALRCPACAAEREQVQAIGIFGQAKSTCITDAIAHRTALLGRKRCPVCAMRLPARAIQQTCEHCQIITFAQISDVNIFLRDLDKQLSSTLVNCFLLSLVPVIGIVPALVYYRLSPLNSLKRYLPRSVGCVTRIGIRMLNIMLIMAQVLPGLGAISIPLMSYINYQVYRGVFTNLAQRTVYSSAAAPAAPAVALPVASSSATLATAQCPGCGAPAVNAGSFCAHCGQKLIGFDI